MLINKIASSLIALGGLFIISGCYPKPPELQQSAFALCNQNISTNYGVQIKGAYKNQEGKLEGGLIYDQVGNKIPMNTEYSAEILRVYTDCLVKMRELDIKEKNQNSINISGGIANNINVKGNANVNVNLKK